jgi:hypothetical protein
LIAIPEERIHRQNIYNSKITPLVQRPAVRKITLSTKTVKKLQQKETTANRVTL